MLPKFKAYIEFLLENLQPKIIGLLGRTNGDWNVGYMPIYENNDVGNITHGQIYKRLRGDADAASSGEFSWRYVVKSKILYYWPEIYKVDSKSSINELLEVSINFLKSKGYRVVKTVRITGSMSGDDSFRKSHYFE